jgi:hypothetical protein
VAPRIALPREDERGTAAARPFSPRAPGTAPGTMRRVPRGVPTPPGGHGPSGPGRAYLSNCTYNCTYR